MPFWTWAPQFPSTSTVTAATTTAIRDWADTGTASAIGNSTTSTVTLWSPRLTPTSTIPIYYGSNGNVYLVDAATAQEQAALAYQHQQFALLQQQADLAAQQAGLGQQQMFNANVHQPFQPAAPNIVSQRAAQRAQAEALYAELSSRAHAPNAAAAEAASARARELLLSFLDAAQAADFERAKEFYVIGRSGARYRVRWGKVANIDCVEGGRYAGNRLCVHPADYYKLPVEDVMLAQLLHLRANDDELARVANVHPGIIRPVANVHPGYL